MARVCVGSRTINNSNVITNDESILRNRKNTILNILNKDKLEKLKCAVAILNFLLEEETTDTFNTDANLYLGKILDKYQTDVAEFTELISSELQIDYLRKDESITYFFSDNKRSYNFYIEVINKLKL